MGDFDNNNSAEEDAEAYAYPVPGECPACGSEWATVNAGAGGVVIKDSNGNALSDGDTRVLIKDLMGRDLKKGLTFRNIKRKLWTRADFMHIHAASGAYFLALGFVWIFYSVAMGGLQEPAVEVHSFFLTTLLWTGFINALSAIPMSRFSSNKMFDMSDLKANGFTFGGSGLTSMCLWIAWWFSGEYPSWLHTMDQPFFWLWATVCAGTTLNWEYMLQQNFEANEQSGRKFAKQTKEEMDQKAFLYRLASWPNLTQLLFIFSMSFGGEAWLANVLEAYPKMDVPLYHYGLASALGYALSMFSETLRDRKLVSLEVDIAILVIGFVFPMLVLFSDVAILNSAMPGSTTSFPPDYWLMFGAVTPPELGGLHLPF